MYELHKTSQRRFPEIQTGFKAQPYARQSIYCAISILEYQPFCRLLLHQSPGSNAAFKNWLKGYIPSLLKTVRYLGVHKILAIAQPI